MMEKEENGWVNEWIWWIIDKEDDVCFMCVCFVCYKWFVKEENKRLFESNEKIRSFGFFGTRTMNIVCKLRNFWVILEVYHENIETELKI